MTIQQPNIGELIIIIQGPHGIDFYCDGVCTLTVGVNFVEATTRVLQTVGNNDTTETEARVLITDDPKTDSVRLPVGFNEKNYDFVWADPKQPEGEESTPAMLYLIMGGIIVVLLLIILGGLTALCLKSKNAETQATNVAS